MSWALRGISAAVLSATLATAATEAPYAFRQRLVTVHRQDRRDFSLRPAADELEIADGARIVVPASAPALVVHAARDFQDYLLLSMGVNASVLSADATVRDRDALDGIPGIAVALDASLGRGYAVETSVDGVRIAAADDKMAAQAFYHLEDLMNLRRGPFLRHGSDRRRPIFDRRLTMSAFGNGIFPDAYLSVIAHHGFTDLDVWIDGYDRISQGARQDINDLIARATRHGLGVRLQPRNRAFVHPDDPRAPAVYDEAYGRLARYYPDAVGISFVGEVCEFPSKDPRSNGLSYFNPPRWMQKDKRPCPGWFPCSDWADWAEMVGGIVRGYNPACKFVFSTYNWGGQDEQARADLVARLPKFVTLVPVFEMFESHVKRNGLVSPVADYTLAFPGPGKYFRTEAAQAREAGLELWSNCSSSGLSWDFGDIPYQPVPWQIKKRWDGLKEAHARWNLTGLRENHEYGWSPSFIAELEKEYLWEGGMDFDDFLAALAARDFGAGNAGKALDAWRRWSRAAADYVPSNENQYGPCRIGPAYPFDFTGPVLGLSTNSLDCNSAGFKLPEGFPLTPGFQFFICNFDYRWSLGGLGKEAGPEDVAEAKEIELFESQVEDWRAGADAFREIAASLPEGRRDDAVRMAALGEFIMRTCLTALHVKKGRIAWRRGDRAAIEALAKAEYANAMAALKVVDEDSQLGYLASSDYIGGRRQIEWKLRMMRRRYGDILSGYGTGDMR